MKKFECPLGCTLASDFVIREMAHVFLVHRNRHERIRLWGKSEAFADKANVSAVEVRLMELDLDLHRLEGDL